MFYCSKIYGPILKFHKQQTGKYSTKTILFSERFWNAISVSCHVTIFSDEAHFHLSGMVNKQNVGYWSENTVILGNSTNDHFIVRRLPFGILWAVLGCVVLTFLKMKVLQWLSLQTVTVKCSRGFFIRKSLSYLLILNPMITAWYGMERKFQYGIWKMPEWKISRME